MDIGEIISDAIRYPILDWKKAVTLGILFLLSFLIIPAFLALGYLFRALKTTMAGFDELPEFDEWGEMIIDGLKVFIVTIVYMIIPMIVIFAGIFTGSSANVATLPGTYTPTIINPAIIQAGGGTTLIGFILAIIFGLLLAIAIAHMAFNESLGAAFQIGEILDVISEIGWADYIIWYIAVMIVSGIIGLIASFIIGLIDIIPLIGPIISFILFTVFVTPYLQLFYYRALGLRYAYE
ncbi:MAG TPA: DUF4013 domain-containing protein [Methanothermobacter sp.]|nr:DUF4013 domain-containing protein [Methanothermobacter sp.]HOL68399.1 DUF4013 domain-containing protein [Methanothermobacter sp.]